MGRGAIPNEADSPMSILIVEDDPLVASTIREVLGALGFAVAGIASSGNEALWLVDQRPPSLSLGPCCTDRSLGGEDWTVYQGPVSHLGQPPGHSKRTKIAVITSRSNGTEARI